jgi:hypothetical protein
VVVFQASPFAPKPSRGFLDNLGRGLDQPGTESGPCRGPALARTPRRQGWKDEELLSWSCKLRGEKSGTDYPVRERNPPFSWPNMPFFFLSADRAPSLLL